MTNTATEEISIPAYSFQCTKGEEDARYTQIRFSNQWWYEAYEHFSGSELTCKNLVASPLKVEMATVYRRGMGSLVISTSANDVCLLHVTPTFDINVRIAAGDEECARAALMRLRALLEVSASDLRGKTRFHFWSLDHAGKPTSHSRAIETPTWSAIASNYNDVARDGLDAIMAWRSLPRTGLHLWLGDPGTGKTTAIRALANSWQEWCTTHVVVDPEHFLGSSPQYLIELLTSTPASLPGRSILVVLEDAGELIGVDARQHAPQAVSRLLNVTDGILGQGLEIALLVTTNEPVGRLHPAVHRDGRCHSRIEFNALPVAAANQWLSGNKSNASVQAATPISRLYAMVEERALVTPERKIGFGIDDTNSEGT